jgi:hypothetical protein
VEQDFEQIWSAAISAIRHATSGRPFPPAFTEAVEERVLSTVRRLVERVRTNESPPSR